jgi:hypothetical protein
MDEDDDVEGGFTDPVSAARLTFTALQRCYYRLGRIDDALVARQRLFDVLDHTPPPPTVHPLSQPQAQLERPRPVVRFESDHPETAPRAVVRIEEKGVAGTVASSSIKKNKEEKKKKTLLPSLLRHKHCLPGSSVACVYSDVSVSKKRVVLLVWVLILHQEEQRAGVYADGPESHVVRSEVRACRLIDVTGLAAQLSTGGNAGETGRDGSPKTLPPITGALTSRPTASHKADDQRGETAPYDLHLTTASSPPSSSSSSTTDSRSVVDMHAVLSKALMTGDGRATRAALHEALIEPVRDDIDACVEKIEEGDGQNGGDWAGPRMRGHGRHSRRLPLVFVPPIEKSWLRQVAWASLADPVTSIRLQDQGPLQVISALKLM